METTTVEGDSPVRVTEVRRRDREKGGTKKRKKVRANGGCLGYPEARKDVVSCEKARGTANRF